MRGFLQDLLLFLLLLIFNVVAGMKFQLRRSTAFNSTIKLFRPVNRENRAFPFFPSTTGLLVTRRKKKERERELKRRHKRRKRGKREREKEIVGSWMNWRTREIKTELECFSSSLSRERARQKSHADFGVNYTYRIT